jgi:putative intracellular protease/amidase
LRLIQVKLIKSIIEIKEKLLNLLCSYSAEKGDKDCKYRQRPFNKRFAKTRKIMNQNKKIKTTNCLNETLERFFNNGLPSNLIRVFSKNRLKISLFVFVLCFNLSAKAQNVLMFLSHEQCYYSEYIVMRKALEAAGYTVDVRSASTLPASIYMTPYADIAANANNLSGSSYTQFIQKYQELTGQAWQNSWNAIPSLENVNGSIQSVSNMNAYQALVIAGGIGALDYRVDGTYSSQGSGTRELTAATIQAAAEKLNSLALEALASGKPVLAQCHGSSLAPFWRIPGTSGPGAEALGFSLLKDNYATGYPDAQTPIDLASLNVNYRAEDRVTISSPHSSFIDLGNGDSKIITSRDWYPQSVLYAAQTLLNIIRTYPTKSQQETTIPVLILHGGALDTTNCNYTNRSNDIPCNHGGGTNFPADFTDIVDLLNANSPNDNFNFVVTDVNLVGTLPYNGNSQTDILNYLTQFKTVVFFKHWSTGISANLQNALVQYADEGGGVIALHHGLYNDIDGNMNKNILVNQLFGVESSMSGWGANLTNYQLVSSNYGHFISSFGINYDNAIQTPSAWSGTLPSSTNASYSYYSPIGIYDELYTNMAFVGTPSFGYGENQITALFSHNQTNGGQVHSSGFAKSFNPSLDQSAGRVVYFQAGERQESININHRYGQIIRNAIVWSANNPNPPLSIQQLLANEKIIVFPNPSTDIFTIQYASSENTNYFITDINGRLITRGIIYNGKTTIDLSTYEKGFYVLHTDKYNLKLIKK